MRLVSLLFHDVYARDPRESGFSSPAADRYKLSIREFEAQLQGIAALASHRGSPHGASLNHPVARTFMVRETAVCLTVDDGGISYYTEIADRLEARGRRGHCFVTTDCIDHPGFLTAAQIRELDTRGHMIGSHTASHPFRFHTCTPDRMHREWADSRRRLEDVVGHAVTAASVPGGFYSPAVAECAANAGIKILFTSEPVTGVWLVSGCLVHGRFTLRAGCDRNAAAKLVGRAPWARVAEWAAWNVKGLLKPVLGRTYPRVADWVSARTASHF